MGPRIQNIETTLTRHTQMLSTINETLSKIAVQDQRINQAEKDIAGFKDSLDKIFDPETGTIQRLSYFQATCPRNQIKWLWSIVLSTDLVLLSLAAKIVGLY